VSPTASYLFNSAAIKHANEPAEDSTRLIWMFVLLARQRSVTYARYAAIFSRGERTFKRDIAKLRELGERFGFALTPQRQGAVQLARFDDDPRPKRRARDAQVSADTVRAVVDALGEVVASGLRGIADVGDSSIDRFLRIATPRMCADTSVGATYARLREAWSRNARVRFRYPAREGGALSERVVEPYLVTFNAGRYYLVGFDVRPRSGGWRQYALDRIAGPLQFAATFTRRPIPSPYRGEDAVGLFKTGAAQTVTIELSAKIADAVIARKWQRAQQAERHSDGRAMIAFEVYDLGEAVRWALGYGAEARIVAPPEAVAHAREAVRFLAGRYADDAVAIASRSA